MATTQKARLQLLVDEAGGPSAFARLVWGDATAHKGKVGKWLHAKTNPHADQAAAICRAMRPPRSVEWFLTGRGPELAPVDVGTGEASSTADPRDKAALQGLLDTLPLRAHLTLEYRALVPVVFKIAEGLPAGRRRPLAQIRRAGQLVGRCVAGPLRTLGIEGVPLEDRRLAQAYVVAVANAVTLVVPRPRA